MELFGQRHTKRELLRRFANPSAACGIRLVEAADGPERGVRMLLLRTGGGIELSILVDRCMDIGEFSFRGTPLGWQFPTGFRAPWLTDLESEDGLGLHRAFSGFWLTCGFDHMRRAARDSAAHFHSTMREEMFHPLHGRGALTPATLRGYGADWVADELMLWAEGEMRQVFMFGENLCVRRRIQAMAGSATLTVTDMVTNDGFVSTPHMLRYHINAGWPLLDEGSRVHVAAAETVHPQPPLPANILPGPGPANRQRVLCHRARADTTGFSRAALSNDRLGLMLVIEYDARVLPWLQEWRSLGEGVYALGLEPLTNRMGSRADLDAAGEILRLEPGASVTYTTRIKVIEGAEAMRAEAAIIAGGGA